MERSELSAPGAVFMEQTRMTMQRIPMTAKGAQALREELEKLKREDRPRITAAIAEAREHGDLKENAEYHAAREQQGFCEGRINEIESKLSAAQIIDITELENTGKVIFGVTVTIIDVDTDEEKVYQIVGDDEANIKQGKLSVNSPIARGLIGREEGDVVQIDTPGGTREYEVDKVEHI
tara:strand:+ start:1284 stop:1820 length:537 start_codon:yes stop_codon:yes gene_type:complete